MIQDRDPGDEIDFERMSESELLAALDVFTDELRGLYVGLTRDEPPATDAVDRESERRRQAEAQEDHRFAAPVQAYRYAPGTWPMGEPRPIASASRWGNP